MSAFGGKADMAFALQMSAFDPKRTSLQQKDAGWVVRCYYQDQPRVFTMAHTVFAVAMALGCLAFSLPAAGADAAAWCAVIKGGEYWDCQYRSLEDCWPNVLGGNRGWCSPNPYVVAMPTESKGSRKRRAPPQ